METEFYPTESARRVVRSAIWGFWLATPLSILTLVGSLVQLATRQIELGDGFVALFVAASGMYVALTLPLTIANQYNRIRVTKDGIYIEVYAFRYRWKFISWGDIHDVELSSKLDRWGNSQWLLLVDNLTYWHSVIAWQQGIGFRPCAVINSDMINGDRLLKIVDKQLTKK